MFIFYHEYVGKHKSLLNFDEEGVVFLLAFSWSKIGTDKNSFSIRPLSSQSFG